MPNVEAMTFVYLDAANQPLVPPLTAAQMNRINSVLVNLVTEAEGTTDVTLTTVITLRN